MNYHTITKCDMINGDGLRVVLWVSGCTQRCIGCQNPETHDKNSGIPFDKQAEDELFEALNHDYIAGITFSGGHPLEDYNIPVVYDLIQKIRNKFPDKTIWLYSGYTWEDIQKNPNAKKVVDLIDVLVDGRFILPLRDTKLKWRGSSNQRIIDVKETIKQNKVILHCE
jgi:anaerobic ribonucleoside-triphosphate reductase activating protein